VVANTQPIELTFHPPERTVFGVRSDEKGNTMGQHGAKKTPDRATVRLVRHGEVHPYVIEVTTPGWRGCDQAFHGKIILPTDLQDIRDILKKANVKFQSVSEPTRDGVMRFNNDGTTEFVLKDSTVFASAIEALVRAGWLSPEVQTDAAINW
jgi:hypothetical protein